MDTRKELILQGIDNCKSATARALPHKDSGDPAIRELAAAIHFLSYGAQQIGLALTDVSRVNDLPFR